MEKKEAVKPEPPQKMEAPSEPKEAPKEQTLRDIALVLDDYSDMFSDFDPRPYGKREFSEDFLKELARRYLEDSKGNFEVRFFIPAYERDLKAEVVIKKRLREHFHFEEKRVHKETEAIRKKGATYVAIGAAVLLFETFVSHFSTDALLASIPGVITLPVGWFFVWTGFERILDTSPGHSKQKQIFEKFAKCSYLFISEDRE